MTKNESNHLQLLRPIEAARLLAVTTQTLSNFRFKGAGPAYVKIGSAVRYPVAALQEYIEAQTRHSRGTGR